MDQVGVGVEHYREQARKLAYWVLDDVMGELDTSDLTERELRIVDLAAKAALDRVIVKWPLEIVEGKR